MKYSTPSTLPRQKLSTVEKTETWGIENLLYWEKYLITSNSEIENDKIRMQNNCNLYYHGILDTLEVATMCNPYDIKDFVIPADFKHHKIEVPKIQTLKGEELKRRFEWKTYVCNRDAISQKEEQKKDQYFQFITDKIKAESFNEDQAKEELNKLQEFLSYDWQELRERTADELLNYFTQYLDVKTQFSRSWEHSMIDGEDIIAVDEHNGKPILEAWDPKTVYWTQSPGNPYIDDSDVIIKEDYYPLGKVIDYYYDFLTPKQISDLEDRSKSRFSGDKKFSPAAYYTKDANGFMTPTLGSGEMLDPSSLSSNQHNFNGYFDESGNIRVVRYRWKSMRKVGRLFFFDESGEQQQKYVDENRKPDKSVGETIEWIWINEAWEGTRIGEDIFIKIQPRNIQFRELDNISACKLGVVGTKISNPVYDILKEFTIKFDAYSWRTEQAMIKAVGKIGVLDIASIPDDWDIDMWMHYATKLGWAVKDSFKEAKKGNAMGKIVGNMSGSSDVINLEQGQFIQQNMMMLQYIEQQMDKVIGINDQRQGQLSANAGLQVTREAAQASSNVTESYFDLHDNVKLRSLRQLLEVAKFCLRGKKEVFQYITSEMTAKIFEVDGDLINEAEFNILIGNANNDQVTINNLREAVKIGLQTGQVDLIQMMDIYSNDSTSSIKRKVEKSVREKQAQEQDRFNQEQETLKQNQQIQYQMHQEILEEAQKDRDLEQYKSDTNNQTKIESVQITALGFAKDADMNSNMVPDVLEQGKLALQQNVANQKSFLDQQKLEYTKSLEVRKLAVKEQGDKLKKDLEDKKLQFEDKKLKSKEKSDKLKADTAIKIAKQNKNKFDKK